MLLEMASVEGEALSEASPGTGEPQLRRHNLNQNYRHREGTPQGFWDMHQGKASSGPLLVSETSLRSPTLGTVELGNSRSVSSQQ